MLECNSEIQLEGSQIQTPMLNLKKTKLERR
jgi:hypothetical protein